MNIKRTVYLFLVLSFIGLLTVFLQYRSTQDYSRTDLRPLNVVLGGDLYVGSRLRNYTDPEGISEFVESVSDRTSSADLHLANLEAPITSGGDTQLRKGYHLRNDPNLIVPVLEALSVDGVSLANNHVLDYGPEGLLSTMRTLEGEGVRFAGAGASLVGAVRPVFFERRNRRIGFLSFSNTFPREFWASSGKPGTAYGNPGVVEELTRYTARRADRVIVSFHWGAEGRLSPKKYQVSLARGAVKAGADVVFGHHPHAIQPMERYRGSLIFYSLGNYMFTTLSHDVNYGLLPEVRFEPGEDPSAKFHVLNVDNYEVHYRPRLVRTLRNPLELSLYIKRPDFVRLAEGQRSWVNPFDSFVNLH